MVPTYFVTPGLFRDPSFRMICWCRSSGALDAGASPA
jgi:hypothetical protein